MSAMGRIRTLAQCPLPFRELRHGSNADGIPLNDGELAWLCRFHEHVRNQFVHFEPMGWSLEVSGIPELGKLIARIIQEMLEAGWAFRHKDDDWKRALLADLDRL